MRQLVVAAALALIASSSSAQMTPAVGGPHATPSLEDVLQLHVIGGYRRGLTLSPDGGFAAFTEQEMRLASNDYDYKVVVVDLQTQTARPIADAGDIILMSENGRLSGSPVDRMVLWSPDGQWLAFLRRVGDGVELWRVRPDGRDAQRVAATAGDVRRFAWTPDGAGLVIQTATSREVLSNALHNAELHGYAVDDRLEARYSLLPMPDEASGKTVLFAGLSGPIRTATAEEAALLDSQGASDPTHALGPLSALPASHGGTKAWADRYDQSDRAYRPLLSVYAQSGNDAPIRCEAASCHGDIQRVWVGADARVYFQRSEGVARSATAIYAWRPGSSEATLIRRADEVLWDCAPSGADAVCFEEATLQPRRLVRINLANGALTSIYDPNSSWRSYQAPRIERIDVHDAYGEPSFGYLFYPRGYQPGRHYPLVMVQYRARGFLHGGTGGEYPIYSLIERGYFVLNIERPDPNALWARMDLNSATLLMELQHVEQLGVQSAIDAMLDVLSRRGDVDMSRLGLTGMSNGAENAFWELQHDNRFAAYAVSSPPTDPIAWPLGSEQFREGLTRTSGASGDWDGTDPKWRQFWRDMSPYFDAGKLHTPVLMQVTDHEALDAFPFYARMRELRRPIDFYIYADEHHAKSWPQHILEVQQRALAWMDFWLRDIPPPPDPNDPGRLARWTAFKAQPDAPSPPSPSPQAHP